MSEDLPHVTVDDASLVDARAGTRLEVDVTVADSHPRWGRGIGHVWLHLLDTPGTATDYRADPEGQPVTLSRSIDPTLVGRPDPGPWAPGDPVEIRIKQSILHRPPRQDVTVDVTLEVEAALYIPTVEERLDHIELHLETTSDFDPV